jgi:hypothetical protein
MAYDLHGGEQCGARRGPTIFFQCLAMFPYHFHPHTVTVRIDKVLLSLLFNKGAGLVFWK